MADKIYGIESIPAAGGTKIQPVRGYTKSEKKEILKRNEELIAAHKEISDIHREIQTKYPNPDKLSFKECLARELNTTFNTSQNSSEEEDGFILDIKDI